MPVSCLLFFPSSVANGDADIDDDKWEITIIIIIVDVVSVLEQPPSTHHSTNCIFGTFFAFLIFRGYLFLSNPAQCVSVHEVGDTKVKIVGEEFQLEDSLISYSMADRQKFGCLPILFDCGLLFEENCFIVHSGQPRDYVRIQDRILSSDR